MSDGALERRRSRFWRREGLRRIVVAGAGGALGAGLSAGWLSRTAGTARAQRARFPARCRLRGINLRDNLDPQTARGLRELIAVVDDYPSHDTQFVII